MAGTVGVSRRHGRQGRARMQGRYRDITSPLAGLRADPELRARPGPERAGLLRRAGRAEPVLGHRRRLPVRVPDHRRRRGAVRRAPEHRRQPAPGGGRDRRRQRRNQPGDAPGLLPPPRRPRQRGVAVRRGRDPDRAPGDPAAAAARRRPGPAAAGGDLRRPLHPAGRGRARRAGLARPQPHAGQQLHPLPRPRHPDVHRRGQRRLGADLQPQPVRGRHRVHGRPGHRAGLPVDPPDQRAPGPARHPRRRRGAPAVHRRHRRQRARGAGLGRPGALLHGGRAERLGRGQRPPRRRHRARGRARHRQVHRRARRRRHRGLHHHHDVPDHAVVPPGPRPQRTRPPLSQNVPGPTYAGPGTAGVRVSGVDSKGGPVTAGRTTPRLIDRGDLLAALDRASARKVTIITAPAGSGKTSLLRTWADRPDRAHRLAMMQVQRDQQDAQQFWLTLLSAIRQASGATSGTEPPAATLDFNAWAMADRVLSELAGARNDVTLVVDDLHELNSPEILAQLTRLLTNLPPGVHAVLTTRHDLRLGLHQLRLAGELAEIRAADLRFTERDTRELLAASGVALSEAGTALLHQRAEGWAAGLRLAVLSLAGHPDPERFVAEFSGTNRVVAEYLLAEMLDRQPPDVQGLLLRTCLLDRVNGELADLLTGRLGSERILLDLEDANAFVVSLDPERTWFRYHHLFADLLRLELRRTLPAEIPALHRRAAGWFTQHGQVAEAIRHTQAAGDWADAARLLADHSFSLTLDGQAQTMQALVRAFPPGADHPELALVRAGGDLAQGRLDEAAAHLAVAATYAETAPPERQRRLRVAIASLQLSLARRRGDLAGVIEHVRFLD